MLRFAVVLGAIHTAHSFTLKCSSIDDPCTCNDQTFCHWCHHKSCHVIGSFWGCFSADDDCVPECKTSVDCIRECFLAGVCRSNRCRYAGFAYDGTVCNDGLSATTNDVCVQGVCRGAYSCPKSQHNTECNDRGSCDHTSGNCRCYQWWTGADCSQPLCEKDCSGRGKCTPAEPHDQEENLQTLKNTCVCDDGWGGSACDVEVAFCEPVTTLSQEFGEFSDNSKEEAYRPNTNCSWVVLPAEHFDFVEITLTQIDFLVHGDQLVIYNQLSKIKTPLLVVDGQLRSKISLPVTIRSSSSSGLVVSFLAASRYTITTNNINYGFHISFKSFAETQPESCPTLATHTASSGTFESSGQAGSVCTHLVAPQVFALSGVMLRVQTPQITSNSPTNLYHGSVPARNFLIASFAAPNTESLVISRGSKTLVQTITAEQSSTTRVEYESFFGDVECEPETILSESFGTFGAVRVMVPEEDASVLSDAQNSWQKLTCAWLIVGRGGSSRIVLDIQRLRVLVSVSVYDGADASAPLLIQTNTGIYDTQPLRVVSTQSSAMFVVLKVPSVETLLMFNAVYFTSHNPQDLISSQPTPPPQPLLSLNWNTTTIVNEKSGEFSDGSNATEPYKSDSVRSWIIRSNEAHSSVDPHRLTCVVAHFTRFDTRWFQDVVIIYDTSPMQPSRLMQPTSVEVIKGQYLSGSGPGARHLNVPFVSSSPEMVIRFATDPSTQTQHLGWAIQYEIGSSELQCAPISVMNKQSDSIVASIHPHLQRSNVVCEWVILPAIPPSKPADSVSNVVVQLSNVFLSGIATVEVFSNATQSGSPLVSLSGTHQSVQLTHSTSKGPLFVRLQTNTPQTIRQQFPAPTFSLSYQVQDAPTDSNARVSTWFLSSGVSNTGIVLSAGVALFIFTLAAVAKRPRQSAVPFSRLN